MGNDPCELNTPFQPVNNWITFAGDMVARYSVGDAQEIDSLHEQICGYVDRDLPDARERNMIARRTAARDAVKSLKESVCALRKSIEHVETSLCAFESSMGLHSWSAVILNEVIDLPFCKSTDLDPPENLDDVRGFFLFNPIVWEEVSRKIDAVLNIPVRNGLRGNKIRNHALEQCLLACRAFWMKHADPATWRRSTLSQPGAIDESTKLSDLAGLCERFVGDMLIAADADISPLELKSGWIKMEERLRAGEDQGTRPTRNRAKAKRDRAAKSSPAIALSDDPGA